MHFCGTEIHCNLYCRCEFVRTNLNRNIVTKEDGDVVLHMVLRECERMAISSVEVGRRALRLRDS
jgi:hypothetical protein